MKEIECTIHGHVHGVGFRAFTKKQAEDIGGIYGFVHNTDAGTVEVVAQGSEDNLEKFITYLQRGPYFADVEQFELEWHDKPSDEYSDFIIYQ